MLISRANQESVTTFGEVLRSALQTYSHNQQNCNLSNDNRMMIYSQGMKIYVPEDFNPDTLLKLLQTVKKLSQSTDAGKLILIIFTFRSLIWNRRISSIHCFSKHFNGWSCINPGYFRRCVSKNYRYHLQFNTASV